MVRGRFKRRFWGLAIGLGLVAPMMMVGAGFWVDTEPIYPIIALFALVGLWFYEDVWVKAGQAVPLS